MNGMPELFACALFALLGAFLVYGLNRQWQWISNPPDWMAAVSYLPAIVKILYGPKYASSVAYLQAYVALGFGLLCSILASIKVLVEALLG